MAESARSDSAASSSSEAPPVGASTRNELCKIVDPNFVINRDTSTKDSTPHFAISDEAAVPEIQASKLSLSYRARLYEMIRVTAKCPLHGSTKESVSWKAFLSELKFLSTHASNWHNHPNILHHQGLVFLKGKECIPYLLSERVTYDLQHLLENNPYRITRKGKVTIAYDIANGLSFLHSRKPSPIVHGALVPSSVVFNEKRIAKLTNFFHAGEEGKSVMVISEHHLLQKAHECTGSVKLHRSLDMASLGYIIKAIDTEHPTREPMTTNILRDLYVLYDRKNGQHHLDELNADRVRQTLFAYLHEDKQLGQQRNSREIPPQPTLTVIILL